MTPARTLAASLVVAALLGVTTGAAPAPGQFQNSRPSAIPNIVTRESVVLAAERLFVDRQYPPLPVTTTGPGSGIPVDIQILEVAGRSPDPRLRREFVRAIGRFEEPADVHQLVMFLNDYVADVRVEAMNALVQALVHTTAANGPQISEAFDGLTVALRREVTCPSGTSQGGCRPTEAAVALASLPIGIGQTREVARLLAEGVDIRPALGWALAGFAELARRHQDLALTKLTRARLRELAVIPVHEPEPHVVLKALETLYWLHEDDGTTILKAATYHCEDRLGQLKPLGCGNEFRHFGVLMIDASQSRFDRALYDALNDVMPQVRLDAIRVAAKAIPTTKTCWPLISALRDPVPQLVLVAIDLMHPACMERDDVAQRLLSWAHELSDPSQVPRWQLPAHALETLTRFLPEEAKKIANDIAAPSDLWQVRLSAARVAQILKDDALAVRLMKDTEPNVRTAALEALSAMHSPARLPAAMASLESTDYLLVMTAALQLRKEALGPDLVQAAAPVAQARLMAAFKRLTDEDKDTSRDPRLELLARLAEFGDANDGDALAELKEYLTDVDPVVASAVADTISTLTGSRPEPKPTRRPVDQPTEVQLREGLIPPQGFVPTALIGFTDGSCMEIGLLLRDAPLASYRFKQLANAGYYNHLTIHRVEAGSLVQGGSPGANEYSGAARFWRDEIGEPHHAGAVGLSTRGRHTGDAQFFINLEDAPQFNHEYTVFGIVAPPLPFRMLEGMTIATVQVFGPRDHAPCH